MLSAPVLSASAPLATNTRRTPKRVGRHLSDAANRIRAALERLSQKIREHHCLCIL